MPELDKERKTMEKNLRVIWLGLSLGAACTPQLPPISIGGSRQEKIEGTIPSRKDSSGIVTPQPGSTAVWITGVEYPGDYDWRTDALMDEAEAEIFLLQEGKKVLGIPAGRRKKHSTDPDRHLFVGNALYDVYSDGDSTYLYKNGREVVRLEDRWELKGLHREEAKTLSLWAGQNGEGMLLMENDSTVMSKSSAEVIGSLHEAAAYPGGALYESEGKICFGYIAGGKQYHLVRDGVDEYVRLGSDVNEVLDMRVIGGKSCSVYSILNRLFLRHGAEEVYLKDLEADKVDGLILFANGKRPMFICRHGLNSGMKYNSVWTVDKKTALKLVSNHAYLDGRRLSLIGPSVHGWIHILNPDNQMTEVRIESYMFSWRFACVHGGHTYMALTPREEGEPLLWTDGKTEPVAVNGFLTGIYVVDY